MIVSLILLSPFMNKINYLMESFKELSKNQKELQNLIAEQWGYKLGNLSQLKNNDTVRKVPPVVANMQVGPINSLLLKSPRIRQVEDQIRNLENERKIMKMNQAMAKEALTYNPDKKSQKQNQKSSVTRMMEEKIREYNYIIDHRHIIDKSSEQSHRIYQLESKTEAQFILDQINLQKEKLSQRDLDLKQQMIVNLRIAKLYREFQRQEFLGSKKDQLPSAILSSPQKGVSTNEHGKTLGIAFKIRHNSMHLRLKQPKSNQFNSQRQIQQLKKQIKDPFEEKSFFDKSKQLDRSISKNIQTLDNWKTKVSEIFSKSKAMDKIQESNQKKIRKLQKEVQRNTQTQKDLYQAIERSIVLKDFASQQTPAIKQLAAHLDNEEKQKHSIFAELLKKKHTKFNKLWGTKILVKYNASSQAKSMLSGRAPETQKQEESPLKTDRVKLDKFGQEVDEEHYWRTCRNQKMNLLLKSKRRLVKSVHHVD